MRKQMDKGKSADNLNKGKSVDNLNKAKHVQPLSEEDRPIVNNRFKKAQGIDESIASLPTGLQSSRHNDSRQSLNSGTRRRREDRKKSSAKQSIQNESP